MKNTCYKILLSTFIISNLLNIFAVNNEVSILKQYLSPKSILNSQDYYKQIIQAKLTSESNRWDSILLKPWSQIRQIQQQMKANQSNSVLFFQQIEIKQQFEKEIEQSLTNLLYSNIKHISSQNCTYLRSFINLNEITTEVVIHITVKENLIPLKIILKKTRNSQTPEITTEIISTKQTAEAIDKNTLYKAIKTYYQDHSIRLKGQFMAEEETSFYSWRDDRNFLMYNNMLGLKNNLFAKEALLPIEQQLAGKLLNKIENEYFTKDDSLNILEIGSGQGVAITQIKEKIIDIIIKELGAKVDTVSFLSKWGLKTKKQFITQLDKWIQIQGITITPYKFQHELVGSACELNWKDNSFDAVISIAAMLYIPDVHIAINEIMRVAKNTAIIGIDHLSKPVYVDNKKQYLWQMFSDFLKPQQSKMSRVFNLNKELFKSSSLLIKQIISQKEVIYDQHQKLIYESKNFRTNKFDLSFLFKFMQKALSTSA